MAAELIAALDYPDARQALALARVLRTQVKWFKVGLELFISAGPSVVCQLKDLELLVFLDLKIYDIPNTAISAAKATARLGADMLTLHCQGGKRMCAGVVEALRESCPKSPLTMGVTALTSFGADEMPGIAATPSEFGLELADLAAGWGLNGVICSAGEAEAIKAGHPDLICVCPGIRPVGSVKDDQSRCYTPAQAVRTGADYLVVGRPINRSPDPARAAAEILAAMASAI